MNKNILVIGGGIAGIQVTTDLGEMGFKVYLVEKTPSIGGRMAQLDKTFPTNDCSICILAPKMSDCYEHENVEVLTYSEVIDVKGKLGDFKVKVLKKPRYVDIEKCTGCGECIEKCPTKVDWEFNMNLNKRKAIYLPFLQAVPKKVTIDPKHCLYLTKGKCGVCKKICKAEAIDYEQKEEILEIDCDAIVIATGFDTYDLTPLKNYGYGIYDNVITALEFERIICASGPTNGHLQRPSDKKTPKKIAFIQCVGSRDSKNNLYCSSVCCMHATKEAILANEHHNDLKSYIFYMDLRAVGKGFQKYIKRAENEYNVEYIRARPAKIWEKENKNLVIEYEETLTSEIKEKEVELVILSQALVSSKSNKEIAEILKISLDEYGFINIPNKITMPVDTDREGIFACGFCQAPMDIPDSVAQSSGTAARVAEVLS